MGIAEILAFFKALPAIVEELKELRLTLINIQNSKTEAELADIKDRLNILSSKLRTTDDKKELADIVRSLNRL